MTESAASQGSHGDSHDQSAHVKTYLRVFFALAVFTAMEYFYAQIFKDAFAVLVLGLMTIAVVKAAMVGMYFMHLKYEGRWVYYMLIPAGILAVILVLALYPDIAMQPQAAQDDGDTEIVASQPIASPSRTSRNAA